VWLHGTDICPIEHLADVSGLAIEEIEDLIDNGVIAPAEQRAGQRYFQLHYVLTVKTARRLRDDFQLDRHGLTLALTLLQRISQLDAELSAIRARLGP
jgi:chaperone modulatory protein CbpM